MFCRYLTVHKTAGISLTRLPVSRFDLHVSFGDKDNIIMLKKIQTESTITDIVFKKWILTAKVYLPDIYNNPPRM